MVHDLHMVQFQKFQIQLNRTHKNLLINHVLLFNCKFKTYYLKLKYNVSKLKYTVSKIYLTNILCMYSSSSWYVSMHFEVQRFSLRECVL